jgi:hypothetical protein
MKPKENLTRIGETKKKTKKVKETDKKTEKAHQNTNHYRIIGPSLYCTKGTLSTFPRPN